MDGNNMIDDPCLRALGLVARRTSFTVIPVGSVFPWAKRRAICVDKEPPEPTAPSAWRLVSRAPKLSHYAQGQSLVPFPGPPTMDKTDP